MRAVKENKEYFIDDSQKGFYLTQGFDIYGDDGELVEAAPGKTVSYDKRNSRKPRPKEREKGRIRTRKP